METSDRLAELQAQYDAKDIQMANDINQKIIRARLLLEYRLAYPITDEKKTEILGKLKELQAIEAYLGLSGGS